MSERAPIIDLDRYTDQWVQEGAFLDADGQAVKAYDDVVLLRPIAIENDPRSAYDIPAGTVGTVLFFVPGGPAELELYWPDGGQSFGHEDTRHLRFHTANEQKYPR